MSGDASTDDLDRTELRRQSRRERTRAATVDEIKQTALAIMRENSTIDVRFADIARAMGLTAPALYRYFADRDELLTAMISDGFLDLSDCLSAAVEGIADDDIADRLVATAEAYRAWAKRDPQRFTLVFGLPVPGYTAPEDGPTVDAARRALSNLGAIVAAASVQGVAQPPLLGEVSPRLATALADKQLAGDSTPAATLQAMMHAWAALHGFVSLETFGHFHWYDEAARDELFLGLVRLSALGMGVPAPGP
ncbi:MAG: WHG domain-containing protein [Mycobacteriales bacterium]